MKLVIIGAAGKTGEQLVQRALAQGQQVTAFVRSEYRATRPDGLRVIRGDARSESDLVSALQGQDAVISALGSEKAGDELMTRFTESLIRAAKTTGVKRVVVLSTFLVTPNYRSNPLVRLILALRRGVDEDKKSSEQLLKSSNLEWTIVYATRLDAAGATGDVRIVRDGEAVGVSDGIARADVADFMLRAVSAPDTVQRSLLVTAPRSR